jgi:hypothetical protein
MNGFKFYPAAWAGALSAVLAVVVSFGFMPQKTADYVATAGVAVLGLVTALVARPVVVPVVAAAIGGVMVGIAGFGVHFTDAQVAGVMAVATMLMTWFVHTNVVPNAGSPSALVPQLAPLVHTGPPR